MSEIQREKINSTVIRFAGDSGDGMQLTGEQFTDSCVLSGNYVCTFPDYPAEIRAPAGTLPGVSGFQIQFGTRRVLTPGDAPEVLVAMNPAALKVNLGELVEGGLLIINLGAFTPENLKKAQFETNPVEEGELAKKYKLIAIDMNEMTKIALEGSPLKPNEVLRCRNFFALGLCYAIFDRPLEYTYTWLNAKWGKTRKELAEANRKVLDKGYEFGLTSSVVPVRKTFARSNLSKGSYRKINGNDAVTLGLLAGAECAARDIVLGSYPITPASSILELFSSLKHFNVRTVQAEDEIAAVGVAIGASFAGCLGITSTSGPGVCLKSEFLGLAVITELPLIIVNVQRGGPSTGLPTKTEQADLFQAIFGRHGESPMPVIAAGTPSEAFNAAVESVRIALTYNTPVMLLTDGYIANGSENWRIPTKKELPDLELEPVSRDEKYLPYARDKETLARKLAFPGRPGFEHTIGGLEKSETGGVSYDPDNHQKMIEIRDKKIRNIAKTYAPINVEGAQSGRLLVVGWGSTYGAISSAVSELSEEGIAVGHLQLRNLFPLPLDLKEVMSRYDRILVPEMNLGQLAYILRAEMLREMISFHKVKGRPFTVEEIKTKIKEVL